MDWAKEYADLFDRHKALLDLVADALPVIHHEASDDMRPHVCASKDRSKDAGGWPAACDCIRGRIAAQIEAETGVPLPVTRRW